MYSKRTLVIITLILIILFVALWAFLTFNKARLSISTDEGATISLAESRDESFKKLGVATAKYATSHEGTVFIRVTKGSAVSERSVQLQKRTTKKVSLDLRAVRKAQRIAASKSALSNLYITQDFVYGLNPQTQSISSTGLGGDTQAPQNFFGASQVKKIHWQSPEVFVYSSSSGQVQFYKNGSSSSFSGSGGDDSVLYDFSKYPGKPLVAYGSQGIYVDREGGLDPASFRQAVPFKVSGSPQIFSDDTHIYFTNVVYPEAEEEGTFDEPERLTITVYDYSGNKQAEYKITSNPPQTVSKVVNLEKSGQLLVFTEEDVRLINKKSGKIADAPFYIVGAQDVLQLQDRTFVLNKDALWEYTPDTETFYKVIDLPRGEVYVTNSLLAAADGSSLYFSSQLTEKELISPGKQSTAANGIYHLTL